MVALATFFMALFQALVVHASEPDTTSIDEFGDNVMRVYLFNEEEDSVLIISRDLSSENEGAIPVSTLMAKSLGGEEVRPPTSNAK